MFVFDFDENREFKTRIVVAGVFAIIFFFLMPYIIDWLGHLCCFANHTLFGGEGHIFDCHYLLDN